MAVHVELRHKRALAHDGKEGSREFWGGGGCSCGPCAFLGHGHQVRLQNKKVMFLMDTKIVSIDIDILRSEFFEGLEVRGYCFRRSPKGMALLGSCMDAHA
eukprot:1160973-Pelagomonas_calceolata.AAC.4